MKASTREWIPVSAMFWLAVALLASSIPLVTVVSVPVWLEFALAIGWRCYLAFKGKDRPGTAVRTILVAVSLGSAVVIHGTLFGLEAGLSCFLLLVALKFVELRSHREFALLCFLCGFVALTGLFSYQGPFITAYEVFATLLGFAALLRLQAAGARMRSWEILRSTGLIGFHAIPVIFLFFLFFPRSQGGFLLRMTKDKALTGMSDLMEPGEYSQLAESQEIAFRADFPEGGMPPVQDLYWRSVVLWEGNGLRWSRGDTGQLPQETPPARGQLVVHRVTLQPHGRRWLFALDHPVTLPRDARMSQGSFVETRYSPVTKRTAYRITSALGPDPTPLNALTRARALQTPKASSAVLALVDKWKREAESPEELARIVLRYFRTEPFRYTLRPGTYAGNGLEEFLLNRRAGYCEHFATAFASVMRLAGVPSRVVGGYRGGLYNAVGDYVMVRQSHAHAWAEIWVPEKGWVRVDPTEVIQPSQVTGDAALFSAFREGEGTRGDQETRGHGAWGSIGETLRLSWDNLNYQWDLWVVGYDQDSQEQFLANIGFNERPWVRALWLILFGTVATLAFLFLALRRMPLARDEVVAEYLRLCRRFARAGVPRGVNEGPQAYGNRLREAFPEIASGIAPLFGGFIRLRYEGKEQEKKEWLRQARSFRREGFRKRRG